MSKITIWFLKCAMIYFVLAMLVGLHMSISGPAYPFKQIHTHLNLLGWMSMFVYGVGYHILPRFSGAVLWSDKLSLAHLWLANIGLIGMTGGWLAASKGNGLTILLVFSLIEGLSIIFFALNMFLTIKPAPAPIKRPSA